MNNQDRAALAIAEPAIRGHEGRRNKIYTDSVGVPTIGIGRNLQGRGLTDDEIEYLYANDMDEALVTCKRFNYWSNVDPVRRSALLNMAFQLGWPRYAAFSRMHAAIANEDWCLAAEECLDSQYAKQVPTRAGYVAKILRTGEIDAD